MTADQAGVVAGIIIGLLLVIVVQLAVIAERLDR